MPSPSPGDLLPKNRIHHCHVKNAAKNADGKIQLSPVDKGIIDWAAQFRALKKRLPTTPSALRPTGKAAELQKSPAASAGPALNKH